MQLARPGELELVERQLPEPDIVTTISDATVVSALMGGSGEARFRIVLTMGQAA